MILAKVVEPIVSTQKHATLHAQQLFWVQPIDANGHAMGDAFIALNSVDAGAGDCVIVCNEGTGCRQISNIDGIFPVNHVIAGYVDRTYDR